ncbi:mechanosensitive ion channel family protein [Thermobifida cellulosilytica]|uniref:Mechanosensitive ion channel protein MscS n=1 Tax=Thermobifida cellulosilytica TB100 TaxID=665004 RepID=A0A147KJA5_THECS|nr:mechanosensitive ion channel domain-containing protein [Thermobifida cellulosilytica]KUP97395.1 mechanosensitive ion channel protein MscS [Thermobifida cellulosilytica TB100]
MSIGNWIAVGVAVAVSVLLVTVLHWLLTHQLSKVWSAAEHLVRRCRYSAYAAATVLGVNLALPNASGFENPRFWYPIFQHGMRIAMIASLTWLGLTVAYAVTDTVLARLSVRNGDADRRSRRLQTQVRLLRRVAATLLGLLAVAAILFTFPAVAALGAGILASAGLIGIIAGVAAQATLGNMFAGLQLAFSDSLRINDVVVVEGEWGRIEELTLTNVTVRTWDERRLVFPVSYFTTRPFENWTKHGSSITGVVMFRVDWEVPVEQLRAEVESFVTNHPLWDGRNWALEVTDMLDSGLIELRATVSAADSSARWKLTVELREHMLGYIRENFPQALPRNRTEFTGMDEEQQYAAMWPASAFRRSPVSRRNGEETAESG